MTHEESNQLLKIPGLMASMQANGARMPFTVYETQNGTLTVVEADKLVHTHEPSVRMLKWLHDDEWPHVWNAETAFGHSIRIVKYDGLDYPYMVQLGRITKSKQTFEEAKDEAQEFFDAVIMAQLSERAERAASPDEVG
jgi:hypothetical protein